METTDSSLSAEQMQGDDISSYENEEKLLSFYSDNRFSQFDTRQAASDKNEPHELIQRIRLL